MTRTTMVRQPPTLRTVAALAGVSTATVARVLRDDEQVAPETRQRVAAVLQVTGYRVNAIARGLRRRRTATVGHLLRGLGPNPFFAQVAIGLQSAAAADGFDVLMFDCQDSARRERVGVDAFIGRRVDAVVFTTPIDADNVAAVRAAGIRAVQVERPTTVDTPRVVVDNRDGSRQAVLHLYGLGHRDIAFIGARPWHDGRDVDGAVEQQRLHGYLEVMEEHGLPARVVLGAYTDPSSRDFQAIGYRHMQQLLQRRPPTAVFAASDLLATGVLQALQKARLWVPDDMSVVGFDDTYAAHLAPPLTTVALPMIDLGRQAFRCAVDEGAPPVVHLPSTLKIRHSTAPAT